jgi:hypothetical protein
MPKNQIDAVVLMQAFQLAWDTALDSELVTAENVQDAPRELLTACMMAAEGTNSDGDANLCRKHRGRGLRRMAGNLRRADRRDPSEQRRPLSGGYNGNTRPVPSERPPTLVH